MEELFNFSSGILLFFFIQKIPFPYTLSSIVMYRRLIRSEGVHEKEWGGSPGSGPTPVESKEVGRDGATFCIINQKQWRKNAEARPFLTGLVVLTQVGGGGGGWRA